MCLISTWFQKVCPNVDRGLSDRLREAARRVLVSIAQVGFTQTPVQGLLLLSAAAVLSPMSAVGALCGAFASVAFGARFGQSDEEQASGLGGYDTTILGLLWGGALGQGGAPVVFFPVALLACLAVQPYLKVHMWRWQLPPMASSGLLMGWLSAGLFSAFGANFWDHPGLLPFGEIAIVVAVGLVGVALFLRSWKGALVCAVMTGVSALGAGLVYDTASPIGPAGLWAFAVAPATFALAGAYLPDNRLGVTAGVLSGVLACAVWMVWDFTGLSVYVPPLLAPIFIGVWVSLILVLKKTRGAVLYPSLMQAVEMIRLAKAKGQKVVALTGAGASTASGIPDYTTGAWLPPGVPVEDYNFVNFQAYERSRALYWAACAHFRDIVSAAQPNPAHTAIAALERCGIIDSVVTQNVDQLHQAAGSHHVTDLHGTLEHVRCISCVWQGPWPEPPAPMACPHCGGLVKPAVVAMGENIPAATWAQAWDQVKDASVVLVVGSQLGITSSATLVVEARRNNGAFIFLTLGEVGVPVFDGDIFLPFYAELALPSMATLLDCKETI
ncbi:urea transporter [Magnetovibrio sp. PR-2]|uniref:urea transporter n=1 Tax=Magnetovibrio sp. PR-2 TaxID=3120356 RepID=UPI002FCE5D1E